MQKIKILRHPLLGETAHFGFCPPKIVFFRGLGGVPEIFFLLGIFIFLWVRTPCKKLKYYDTPLCHFGNGGNKKKKRKIPKIVAYGCFDETVCTAPLGPKTVKTLVLVISCMVGYKQLTEDYDPVQILYKCKETAGELMCTIKLVAAKCVHHQSLQYFEE